MGGNFSSTQVLSTNPPSHASGAHVPAGLGPAPGAFPEPSRRRRHSDRRELSLGVWEARLQLPRRQQCSNTKAAMEGGEYIKITGTVIAFYINDLFKSFPQCESPSSKRINSWHTNLFCAYRWSIMKTPPSTPDGETSSFHLTRLRVLPAPGQGVSGPRGLGGVRGSPATAIAAPGAAGIRTGDSAATGAGEHGSPPFLGTGEGRCPARLGDQAPLPAGRAEEAGR